MERCQRPRGPLRPGRCCTPGENIDTHRAEAGEEFSQIRRIAGSHQWQNGQMMELSSKERCALNEWGIIIAKEAEAVDVLNSLGIDRRIDCQPRVLGFRLVPEKITSNDTILDNSIDYVGKRSKPKPNSLPLFANKKEGILIAKRHYLKNAAELQQKARSDEFHQHLNMFNYNREGGIPPEQRPYPQVYLNLDKGGAGTSTKIRSPSERRNPSITRQCKNTTIRFLLAMEESNRSQRLINDWDRKMGLRKSHSKTMSLSSESRVNLKCSIRSSKSGVINTASFWGGAVGKD